MSENLSDELNDPFVATFEIMTAKMFSKQDEHRFFSSYSSWFQATFLGIGTIEVLFAVASMLQGPSQLMSQFGIPTEVLNSPHYLDAMFWVVLHMCNIGIICIALGLLVRDETAQRWLPRIFVLIHLIYAYLDIRASDNPLGTGLYQGPASNVPAIFSCIFFVVMLHLTIRSFARGTKST